MLVDAPNDQIVERQVNDAIKGGMALPRWGWPVPRSYNGATGKERIAGWQKVLIAERLGLLPPRGCCSLCAVTVAEQRHTELYFRPIMSMPVCRSCHFAIHRRFNDPRRWQAFLAQRNCASSWSNALRTIELGREDALRISAAHDVFAALASEVG